MAIHRIKNHGPGYLHVYLSTGMIELKKEQATEGEIYQIKLEPNKMCKFEMEPVL